MIKNAIRFSVFLSMMCAAACTTSETSTTGRLTIQMSCGQDADCPAGFSCELEVEHGVTTSVCRSDDSSDATCPPGYELEIEHGEAFCKLHGGGGSGADDGGVPGGSAACTTDADCPAGEECEVELEHGQTTSSCKPHGGRSA